MIQDETEKDQKPEEVQISFSPYFTSRTDKAEVQAKVQTKNRDSRRTIEKGSREGDARRAGSTSVRFSSKKAPPDMETGRSSRTCLSRGVPADHEAQSQVKRKTYATPKERLCTAEFTIAGRSRVQERDTSHQHTRTEVTCDSGNTRDSKTSQQCRMNQGTTQWRMCVDT